MASAAGHARHPLPVLNRPRVAPRFVLTLFTDDPALARRADEAGIDRIGPDFELRGKARRQRGLGYRISHHRADRLPAVRAAVRHGGLFARTDPVHPRSGEEVERLLAAGVEVLMLPMFRDADEVDRFARLVAGRARLVLLLECAEAVRRLDEILAVPGVDEVHVGLNDLALDLGVANRFRLLAMPLLDEVAERVHSAELPLGVGGVGRVTGRRLPVAPNLVYAAIGRLGATSTLLARCFVRDDGADLAAEVARTRDRLAAWWGVHGRAAADAVAALERATR